MKIENYKNLGELGFMTHIYQLINDNGKIILIRAYDIEPAKLWYGTILRKDKSYTNLNLDNKDKIIPEIKKYVGSIEVIKDLKDFINDTFLENFLKECEEKEL
jgi:hypothetical protein